MMRALAAAMVCALGLGAQSKTDLERLQGTWSLISPAGGGQITVQGNRFSASAMGSAYAGTFELDTTQSPPAITMKFTEGPEAGNRNYGIYQVDDYGWRLCLATRGTERPRQFAADLDRGIVLEVLRRGSSSAAPSANTEGVRFELMAELAGEWKMVSGTVDGQPLPANMVTAARRVVDGSEVTVRFGPQVYSRAKFTVDRTQRPMTMDAYYSEGANAGKLQRGIFELDGDTLKVCFGPAGGDRPGEFASRSGDGRTFSVWTRVK